MSGTPQCVEDRRRGLYSYEALRSRLTQGRFGREGMRDMLAPVIHLEPLTYEELLVLVEKLADIHAGLFGYARSLTEDDLVGFLQAEYGRVGADTHLTPREVIRDFIELLDILCQNPQVTLTELLQSDEFAHMSEQMPASAAAGAPSAPLRVEVPASGAGAGRDPRQFAEFTL